MKTTADILAARARALARPTIVEDELSPSEVLTVLVISMGEERLGVPVEQIAAIVRAARVTPLPRSRLPVHGVTAWRGRPLTIFWLSSRQPSASDASRFVVLGDARRPDAALLVDEVDDVRVIARSSLTIVPGDAGAFPTLGISHDAVRVLDPVALLHSRTAGPVASPDRMRTS